MPRLNELIRLNENDENAHTALTLRWSEYVKKHLGQPPEMGQPPEYLEDQKYDNRNFRKKMISSEIVEETKQMETGVSHRPARLFQFN